MREMKRVKEIKECQIILVEPSCKTRMKFAIILFTHDSCQGFLLLLLKKKEEGIKGEKMGSWFDYTLVSLLLFHSFHRFFSFFLSFLLKRFRFKGIPGQVQLVVFVQAKYEMLDQLLVTPTLLSFPFFSLLFTLSFHSLLMKVKKES